MQTAVGQGEDPFPFHHTFVTQFERFGFFEAPGARVVGLGFEKVRGEPEGPNTLELPLELLDVLGLDLDPNSLLELRHTPEAQALRLAKVRGNHWMSFVEGLRPQMPLHDIYINRRRVGRITATSEATVTRFPAFLRHFGVNTDQGREAAEAMGYGDLTQRVLPD
jgi:hypothetical protein